MSWEQANTEELVSLDRVWSWSWATLRCPWSITDLLQLCLWCLCLRRIMQSYTLAFLDFGNAKSLNPLLAAQNQFW